MTFWRNDFLVCKNTKEDKADVFTIKIKPFLAPNTAVPYLKSFSLYRPHANIFCCSLTSNRINRTYLLLF